MATTGRDHPGDRLQRVQDPRSGLAVDQQHVADRRLGRQDAVDFGRVRRRVLLAPRELLLQQIEVPLVALDQGAEPGPLLDQRARGPAALLLDPSHLLLHRAGQGFQPRSHGRVANSAFQRSNVLFQARQIGTRSHKSSRHCPKVLFDPADQTQALAIKIALCMLLRDRASQTRNPRVHVSELRLGFVEFSPRGRKEALKP